MAGSAGERCRLCGPVLRAVQDRLTRGAMGVDAIWRSIQREENIHVKR